MTNQERLDKYRQHCHTVSLQMLNLMKEHGDDWTIPWHKNAIALAMNRVTGRFYRGNNLLILMNACIANMYSTNNWATLKQWSRFGAKVRKGQRGTLICIAFPRNAYNAQQQEALEFDLNLPNPQQHQNQQFIFRTLFVFNQDQLSGIDIDQLPLFQPELSPQAAMQELIIHSGARIIEGGTHAYYSIREDAIHMPPMVRFKANHFGSAEDHYFATLMHEMIHWSGNQTRCNRPLSGNFETPGYAFEELIAELGSSFLCTHFQQKVQPMADHAKYLNMWFRVLEKDFSFFLDAMNKAVDATLWLLKTTNSFTLRVHPPDHAMNVADRTEEWSRLEVV